MTSFCNVLACKEAMRGRATCEEAMWLNRWNAFVCMEIIPSRVSLRGLMFHRPGRVNERESEEQIGKKNVNNCSLQFRCLQRGSFFHSESHPLHSETSTPPPSRLLSMPRNCWEVHRICKLAAVPAHLHLVMALSIPPRVTPPPYPNKKVLLWLCFNFETQELNGVIVPNSFGLMGPEEWRGGDGSASLTHSLTLSFSFFHSGFSLHCFSDLLGAGSGMNA